MFMLVLIILSVTFEVFTADPIIHLPNGQIRGKLFRSKLNHVPFYAYQGIPFAAPPVGKLRFQPPQPAKSWTGIKTVYSSEISCHQVQTEDRYSSEDCMYLSVLTPAAPSITNSTLANNLIASDLPVLVFFYGGAFINGHMNYGVDHASFLMQEGIILVDFNYRVGPFGFLSTEDLVVPGNMGLKDQQFALKWVRQNIHLFGGDPNKVTIMGSSAGAASVTYQALAPGSAGLFKGIISSSGSALCSWANQKNAKDIAYGIAAEINLKFTKQNSTKELLEFLQSVDAKLIQKTGTKFGRFSPVIEVPHTDAIISDYMYNNAANGKFNKIPILMGHNSEESLYKAEDMPRWLQIIKHYDENSENLINSDIGITDKNIRATVGKEIKQMYVGNELFVNNPGKAIQWSSDDDFTRPIIKLAELFAEHTNVYFYQFSYHGVLGGDKVSVKDAGKVTHIQWFNDTTDYLRILLSIRKNPTPSKDPLLENVIWPRVEKGNYNYLDIDTNLVVRKNPRQQFYSMWTQIFEMYGKKPFISY